ncbi:hypothetical protein LIER_42407 [Lithospermum erythrorhizon]|uniref:Uncharacterized protein n=1 Tax=Lithospermum erythrorhizon TaxID=34254 RepID=A0AAV3RR34_LITER
MGGIFIARLTGGVDLSAVSSCGCAVERRGVRPGAGRYTQPIAGSHLPWEQALLEQDRRVAEERWATDIRRAERRRVTAQVARRETDDLLSACHREAPLRNHSSRASVLADFVLDFQNQVPQLPAMA